MAASCWMFENVPAGVNLSIQTEDGNYNQPLPASPGLLLRSNDPYLITFTPQREGTLSEVTFGHAANSSDLPVTVDLTVFSTLEQDVGLAYASSILAPAPGESSLLLKPDQFLSLTPSQRYILKIETSGAGVYVSNSIDVVIQTNEGAFTQALPIPAGLFVTADTPYILTFTPAKEGTLVEVGFGYALDVSDSPMA